jgi:hypothetical protein
MSDCTNAAHRAALCWFFDKPLRFERIAQDSLNGLIQVKAMCLRVFAIDESAISHRVDSGGMGSRG